MIYELVGRAALAAALLVAVFMVHQWAERRLITKRARQKRIRAQLQAADGRRILARLDAEAAEDNRLLCEELALLPESEESND